MSEKEEYCSECGECVDVKAGHPRNWPRRLARKHIASDAATAAKALAKSVDEYNIQFVVGEFFDEWLKHRAVHSASAGSEPGSHSVGERVENKGLEEKSDA